MVAAEETIAHDVVDDLQKKHTLSDKVLTEVDQYRKSSNAAPDKLNKALSNILPDLQIVESDDDHVTLSDRANTRTFYVNSDLTVGDHTSPKRQVGFDINPDGTATHIVQPGETVWKIVKAELWSKNGEEPSDEDVKKEIDHIRDLNKHIPDLSKIKPGDPIHLPKESVDAAHEGRPVAEKHTSGDGTVRNISRDAEGNVSKVSIERPGSTEPEIWVRDEKEPRTWHQVDAAGKKVGEDWHGDIRCEGDNYIHESDDSHERTIIDKSGNQRVEVDHKQTNGTTQTIEKDKDGNVVKFRTVDANNVVDTWVVNPSNPKEFQQVDKDGKPTGKVFHGTVKIENGNYIQEDEDKHQRTTWDKDGNVSKPVDIPEVHQQTNGTTQTIEHDENGRPSKVTVQTNDGQAPRIYVRDAQDANKWHCSQGGVNKGEFYGDIYIKDGCYVYDDARTHRRTSIDSNGTEKETDAPQVHKQADGTTATIEHDKSGNATRVIVENPDGTKRVYVRDPDDARVWHYTNEQGELGTFNGEIFIDGDKYGWVDDKSGKRTTIDSQGNKV